MTPIFFVARMRFAAAVVLCLSCLAVALPSPAAANDINNALRVFVQLGVPGDREVSRLLQREYARRNYEPLWIGANELSAPGQRALALVQRAEQLGVVGRYADTIHPNVDRYDYSGLAKLDYELTVSLLQLLSDISEGHIEPIVDDSNWANLTDRFATTRRLSREMQTSFIDDLIARESPPRPEYQPLLRQLDRYNRIVERGGWPQLTADGPTLRPEMVDEQVAVLRQRLKAEGFIFADSGEFPELYDQALLYAVQRFQINSGLNPDGIIGPNTRKVLNITAEQRRQQLLVNLERMRWLPEDLGERYLWVNVPNYRLTIYDQQQPTLDMAVIVGRSERPTPVFYDKIEYLEINPYWNVPDSIAYRDYLPKIMRDVSILDKEHIKVRENWRKNAKELDPYAIDWLALFPEYALIDNDPADVEKDVIDVDADTVEKSNKRRFPFHLRQEPGAHNSLGRVKFMFPNEHYVYLHDTPKQYLFNHGQRAFSSGCVRVANPSRLAQFLMDTQQVKNLDAAQMSLIRDGQTAANSVDYEALLATGENQQVVLAEPLPVYLVYFTAWVDLQGRLQFRDDIYGRDAKVAERLAAIDNSAFTQSRLAWADVPRMFPEPKPAANKTVAVAVEAEQTSSSELSDNAQTGDTSDAPNAEPLGLPAEGSAEKAVAMPADAPLESPASRTPDPLEPSRRDQRDGQPAGVNL